MLRVGPLTRYMRLFRNSGSLAAQRTSTATLTAILSAILSALGALAALALACGVSAPAQAAGAAHEHGVARMTLVQDGAQLVIELTGPLEHFVGFERAPRNEREREAVRDMARKLREASLLAPHVDGQCRAVAPATLSSTVLEPALLDEGGAAARVERSNGLPREHAELQARWEFNCTKPNALKAVEVRLTTVFRKLGRIEVQLATPAGQGRRTLNHNARELRW